MKDIKDMMADKTITSKKEIGERFQIFRDTIGKTHEELGSELSIGTSVIAETELGKTYLRYDYLLLMSERFGLNIDWLVDGKESLLSRYTLEIHVSERVHGREQIEELARILRHPEIKTLMLVRLAELKLIFKDELNAFFEQEAKAKKGLVAV